VVDVGSGEVDDSRQETAEQRNDRNLGELVQELRVAGLGVQVLFGFLLSLPFSSRFGQLSDAQRDLYLTCVVLSAVATTLLVGPVAYHRLVFRRGMKEDLVQFANLLAILGLTAVGGAVLAAVLLVTWFVGGPVAGALITAVIGVMIGGLWFGTPLVSRRGTARLSVSAECFGFPPGLTTVSAGRLRLLRFAVGKEAGRGGGNGLPGQAVVARGAAAGAW
jgi:uncharacterized protein DUF6328